LVTITFVGPKFKNRDFQSTDRTARADENPSLELMEPLRGLFVGKRMNKTKGRKEGKISIKN